MPISPQAADLGYEVAASNAAFLLDEGKIRLDGELFQGELSDVQTRKIELKHFFLHVILSSKSAHVILSSTYVHANFGDHTGGRSAPVWSETMAVRLHIMAATKGYAPSFLAIGDAFFYGRAGLPR